MSISPRSSFSAEFSIGELLGEGGCGEVRHCIHRKSGKKFAVKVVDKHAPEHAIEAIRREVSLLYPLTQSQKSQWLTKNLGYYENQTHLFCVMDEFVGGDLYNSVFTLERYPENVAARVVHNLLSCTQFIHAQNVVHRDIKMENIMLRENLSSQGIIVTQTGITFTDDETLSLRSAERRLSDIALIDFGLAAIFVPGNPHCLTDAPGTLEYMAPEMIETLHGMRKGYDEKCDLWAIGVVTFVLLFGDLPFSSESPQALCDMILAGFSGFPEVHTLSVEAQSFVKELLTSDPEIRPSASAALQHAWLQKLIPSKDGFAPQLMSDTPQKAEWAVVRVRESDGAHDDTVGFALSVEEQARLLDHMRLPTKLGGLMSARRINGRVIKDCFSGKTAVEWLAQTWMKSNKKELALAYLNILWKNNVFLSVNNTTGFLDSETAFYTIVNSPLQL